MAKTHAPVKNVVGEVFGRLTITKDFGYGTGKQGLGNGGKNLKVKFVECLCACGNITNPNYAALRSGIAQSCGCLKCERVSAAMKKRIGPLHHLWRGGRRKLKCGYIRVPQRGHPRAVKGYVLEHILVMERKIGRSMLPGETVHHINGVRDDNRPENLELWDRNHGGGQRHVEKMAHYTSEIMAKASDEELGVIIKSLQNRVRQRATRPIAQQDQPPFAPWPVPVP